MKNKVKNVSVGSKLSRYICSRCGRKRYAKFVFFAALKNARGYQGVLCRDGLPCQTYAKLRFNISSKELRTKLLNKFSNHGQNPKRKDFSESIV